MKAGDLVQFKARAWVFDHANQRYTSKNPGIILESNKSGGFYVLWADETVSQEHGSYLHNLGSD